MKRSRNDKVCVDPKSKWPYNDRSSRGESDGLPHGVVGSDDIDSAARRGTGGNHNINGDSSGVANSGASVAAISTQKLNTIDALSFLKQVKDMFQDQGDTYDKFLDVVIDFKDQSIDTPGIRGTVEELLKGHRNLILGFNKFMPKGYEIILPKEKVAPPKRTPQFEESINFINKIKKRFENKNDVYKSFLNILNMSRKEHKGVNEVYQEVAELFNGHPDLLDEFIRFLPYPSATASALHASTVRQSYHCAGEGRSALPLRQSYVDEKFQQHLWKDGDNESNEGQDFSIERPDMNGGKTIKKLHKEHKKVTDKENRGRKNCDEDDRNPDAENAGTAKHKLSEKRTFTQKVEACRGSSNLASNDDKKSLKKTLWNEGSSSKVARVHEKDKESKHEVGGKEKDKRNLKYWGKPIHEIDLSNCQSCTPSYRLLPEDYPISIASERSEDEAKVLNDHWVCVRSGNEDYSFKQIRNPYEESLFRCEDDRFELDMLLESFHSAANATEELISSLNNNSYDSVNAIRIEDHLTASNLRCIERLYSDHGLDMIDNLRNNPSRALPVILPRLRQKLEEFTESRIEFNKVWAEVYSRNHYKALEHRSFEFKQRDSKNLSTKCT